MNNLEILSASGIVSADQQLSPEDKSILEGLTAEEVEALSLDRSALTRPDRKGVPTFHVGV